MAGGRECCTHLLGGTGVISALPFLSIEFVEGSLKIHKVFRPRAQLIKGVYVIAKFKKLGNFVPET